MIVTPDHRRQPIGTIRKQTILKSNTKAAAVFRRSARTSGVPNMPTSNFIEVDEEAVQGRAHDWTALPVSGASPLGKTVS